MIIRVCFRRFPFNVLFCQKCVYEGTFSASSVIEISVIEFDPSAISHCQRLGETTCRTRPWTSSTENLEMFVSFWTKTSTIGYGPWGNQSKAEKSLPSGNMDSGTRWLWSNNWFYYLEGDANASLLETAIEQAIGWNLLYGRLIMLNLYGCTYRKAVQMFPEERDYSILTELFFCTILYLKGECA